MRRFRFRSNDHVAAFVSRYHGVDEVLGQGWMSTDEDWSLAAFAGHHRRSVNGLLLELALRVEPRTHHPCWDELAGLPVVDLVTHIVQYHHGLMEAELGRMDVLVQHLTGGQGPLAETFAEFTVHHRAHLTWEEQVVFPVLLDQDRGFGHRPTSAVTLRRHAEFAQTDLHGLYPGHPDDEIHVRFPNRLRQAVADGETHRVLLRALAGFEEDLLAHNACEYHLLHPSETALAMPSPGAGNGLT